MWLWGLRVLSQAATTGPDTMFLKERILLAAPGRLQPPGLQAMAESRQSALLVIPFSPSGPQSQL